jgi:hypothetical protein
MPKLYAVHEGESYEDWHDRLALAGAPEAVLVIPRRIIALEGTASNRLICPVLSKVSHPLL